jgi:hypothetical protein
MKNFYLSILTVILGTIYTIGILIFIKEEKIK